MRTLLRTFDEATRMSKQVGRPDSEQFAAYAISTYILYVEGGEIMDADSSGTAQVPIRIKNAVSAPVSSYIT